MSHPSYHHDVNLNLTDAYFFEAYVRMANKLLKPFKGDPDVVRFLSELPHAHIVEGPTSDARDLRALAVERSFVVPAFPAPTVPSYRNYDTLKNPVHLYTRKHYKSSQISPVQIKENDQLWFERGAFDGYYEGWPSCVAIPRVIDLRNSPDVRTGTSDMLKDFNESYMVSEEHGGTFHVWHQLEIKVKNEGESGQSNQKHRDELRRGMPASPLITYFRLNIVEKVTQETISSSIFRCVVVKERDGIHYRPWTQADGVSHLPALHEALSDEFFHYESSDSEDAHENAAAHFGSPRRFDDSRQHPHVARLHPHDLSDVRLPPLRLRSDSAHGQHHYALGHRQRRIYGQSHARSAL